MRRPGDAERRGRQATGGEQAPDQNQDTAPALGTGSDGGRGRPTRGRGRPRDPRAHEAIIDATIELLGEVGYAKLTIEAIAARARVGKTTIYRRWKSKGLLVVEVLAGLIRPGPEVDTGDTRADLIALVRSAAAALDVPVIRHSIPGLAIDLHADEALASAFRERIIGPRGERVTAIMARAVARGEVPAGIDVELVTDMLLGPLLWRAILTQQPLDDEAIARIVDHVLTGAQAATQPGGAG